MYFTLIALILSGCFHFSIGQDCQPGTFINQSLCDDCPMGTFSNQVNQSSCTNCTAGTFGNETGLIACLDCPLGTFSDTEQQTSCTPCPEGQFANGAANVNCTLCLPGTFSNIPGAPVCQDCTAGFIAAIEEQTECDACPQGTFINVPGMDLCMNCTLGTFTNTTGNINCTDCPAGFIADTTGSVDCSPCPSGQFADQAGQSRCNDCQSGTFNNWTAQSNCEMCPNGTTNFIVGATMQTQCDIEQCVEGEFYDNETCVACPVGSYQQVPDQQVYHLRLGCDPCQDQFTTSHNGTTLKGECYRICEVGERPNVMGMDGVCEPCPPGQYQPQADQASCLFCEDGTTTREPGSTNATLCEVFCLEGLQQNTSGICVPCPVGYYRDIADGIFSDCQLCPTDYITELEGSVSADNCTVANCNAGYYRNVTENACTPCLVGTYQPDPWAEDSCISCAHNYTTLRDTSTASSDCFVVCEAGEYNVDTDTCFPCAVGTYKEQVDAALNCTLCPAENRTQDVGATSAQQCDIGNCTAGQFTQADWTCGLCAVGTYQNVKWQNECKPCGSNSRGVILTTPAEGTKISEDCFDPIDRDNPAVTSLDPALGPVSGGTNVTLSGRGFRALQVRLFLGNDTECLVYSWTETAIMIKTPAMNDTEEDKEFVIIVELDGLNNITTDQIFIYTPDPTITQLYPLTTIRLGGTTLFVEGEYLDVIANPVLGLTVFIATVGQPSANVTDLYFAPCDVQNSTLMTCVLPDWDFPEDLVSVSRRKRDLSSSIARVRRQTFERFLTIYLGFKLDDVRQYLDIDALGDPSLPGSLTLIGVPTFEGQSSKFEPDTNIVIQGKSMKAVLLSEYAILIGADDECAIMELTDDSLTCLPPQEKPERVHDSNDPDPRVLVSVGQNYNTSVGSISYSSSIGTTTIIVIGVVCAVVVIGIAIAVVVLLCVQRRRHKHKHAQREALVQEDGIIVLPDPNVDGGTIASKRANSLSGRGHGGGLDRLFTAGPPRETVDTDDRKKGGVGKKRPPVSNNNFIMYPPQENNPKKRLRRRPGSEIPTMNEDEELSQAFNNFRQKQSSQDSYLTPRDISKPNGSPGTSGGPRKSYENVFNVNDNVHARRPRSAAPSKEGLEFDRMWDRVGEDDGPKFSDNMMNMIDRLPTSGKSSQPHFSTATADMW